MHYSVQATSRIKQLFEHGIYIYSFAYEVKSCEFPLYGALPYFLKYGAPLELCP